MEFVKSMESVVQYVLGFSLQWVEEEHMQCHFICYVDKKRKHSFVRKIVASAVVCSTAVKGGQ